MKTMEVDNWFDCGKREIVLETNASLLEKLNDHHKFKDDYPDAIIIPPVSIGKNCVIEHSIIGAYVSISEHTERSRVAISNSIIGNYDSIKDIVLESSIIGSDTAIKGAYHSLNIGDNTEMDLG